MASRTLYRIIWVPSAIGLAGAVGAFALQPHPVPAPAELVTFTSNDKTLSVRHPSNWKSVSMSIAGGNTVEVEYKPVKNSDISFSTDLQGSLMADIARSSNNMMPDTSSLPPELGQKLGIPEGKRKTPLETLHESEAKGLEKVLDKYEEGKTSKTQLSGLEAIETDFTCQASDIFSKKTLVGKRITALSNERRVRVMYYIPKESEEKLLPTIREMINSLHIGQQGG